MLNADPDTTPCIYQAWDHHKQDTNLCLVKPVFIFFSLCLSVHLYVFIFYFYFMYFVCVFWCNLYVCLFWEFLQAITFGGVVTVFRGKFPPPVLPCLYLALMQRYLPVFAVVGSSNKSQIRLPNFTALHSFFFKRRNGLSRTTGPPAKKCKEELVTCGFIELLAVRAFVLFQSNACDSPGYQADTLCSHTK